MNIAQYNAYLEQTRVCAGCPMLGHGTFVGADSANHEPEQQTILFLGLNPGIEEARQGLPFVGPSGRFLRAQLEKAEIDSWAMANSLLCSSHNESTIIKPDESRAACHGNVARIFRTFQPGIIVPCGNGAWSIFRVNMPITLAAENYFVSTGPTGKSQPVLVMPILHPSALIRAGGEKSANYGKYLLRLQNLGRLANMTLEQGANAAIDYLNANDMAVHQCFTGKMKTAKS